MKEWDQLLSNLTKEISAPVVERWLKTLRVVRFDAANLFLEAQDPMQVAWFEEHIRHRLKKGFFNENHRPIKVHITKQPTPNSAPTTTIRPMAFISDPVDPSLTLDNFYVTPENAMVHKLLNEWVKTGQSTFNPIFLYGPKGAGKTHLLTGTANICEQQKKKYLYITADTFTEHVVQAIRMSRMQEFRKIYREIDVLLVDDIDLLAKRTATQEEFFHTFNTLHLQNKQIILSSISPPSKLTDIEFRLISRFEWGLPAGFGKVEPGKILERKAHLWNFELSSELSQFLLEHFPNDPILALQALTLRTHAPKVTPLLAKSLLSDLLKKELTKQVTPEKIVKALAAHFGITADDILGKAQTKDIAFPRQIAMYICREKLKLPYQAIGKVFGRDHSTVMSSIKQIEQKIENKEAEILTALNIQF